MIYKCHKVDFLQYETLKDGDNYRKPIQNDIVLLYLERSLSLRQYPQIGFESKNTIDLQAKLQIQGYPSEKFFRCGNIFDAYFEKISLKGELLEIKDDIIYHNLKSEVGHSGSAITTYDRNEEEVVVGIHTH
jgi:V8-like Glu-specific endopeptidase